MRSAALAALVVAACVSTAVVVSAQQPAAAPAPSSLKIGYIDVQRVLARSAAGVAARDQLE
jgi:Skp family chaperone for outer membrane proteins